MSLNTELILLFLCCIRPDGMKENVAPADRTLIKTATLLLISVHNSTLAH